MYDTLPKHLPRKLTITLWDFSWYTMTMPGEPFDNLDRAFSEAVERGYNTIRICAMPFLLFGPHELWREPMHLANLGKEFGRSTRWYNAKGGAVLNGREHLLELFRAAKRHNCSVILSSWEYQQSSSFLATPVWYEALMAIPPQERHMVLAEAIGKLIQFLKDHQLDDRIAYAEIHNEVDSTRLSDVAQPGEDVVAAQQPYLEAALSRMRALHPDIPMTYCYGTLPMTHMRHLPENVQVAHFHIYVYGVLGQLLAEAGQWPPSASFPNDLARSLIREDAPPFSQWVPEPGNEWRLKATAISRNLVYMHDWIDQDTWDLWLYEHYGPHREAMRQKIKLSVETIADWAEARNMPAVIGEGYIGYTPLLGTFEEGPVGKDLAEYAIEQCLQHNFWGIILCSNAAPHHPFWQDVAWQKKMNARILHTEKKP